MAHGLLRRLSHPDPPQHLLPFSSLDVATPVPRAATRPDLAAIRIVEAPPLSPKRGELEYDPSVHGRTSMDSIFPPSPGPSPSTSTTNLIAPPSRPASPSPLSFLATPVAPPAPPPRCANHPILVPAIHFAVTVLFLITLAVGWAVINHVLARAQLNGLILACLNVLLVVACCATLYLLWRKSKALYLPLRRRYLDDDPRMKPVDGEDEKPYAPRRWAKWGERALWLKPAVVRPPVPCPSYQAGPAALSVERAAATVVQSSDEVVADPLDLAIERAANGGAAPMCACRLKMQ